MKRIVILIDGTWNEEGKGNDTNIAKLDPLYKGAGPPLIKAVASDGVTQSVFYHKGVGAEPDLLKRLLGGAIGLGLKAIIVGAYRDLVKTYAHGDEIHIIGFSRGAYAARALAGMIGASGIVRSDDPGDIDAAWNYYRVRPSLRNDPAKAGASDQKSIGEHASMAARDALHADRAIRSVAVFDTVGSYGIPAGIGLAPLARYFALATLGFHDTSFGGHIDVGLHALALDERRRPFNPTLWTAPKDSPPRGHVEQTWFSGVHCNVGGGYPDSGLSDEALVWMIARLEALAGIEFDLASVRLATKGARLDGEVYDSTKGWIIDRLFPKLRKILSPDAIDDGFALSGTNPREFNVGERVHWSLLAKRGRPCTIDGVADTPYGPLNLPRDIAPEAIAAITPGEKALLAPPP